MPKKIRTLEQVRAMQDKAVRFLRDVVDDPDKAVEFDLMSPEEYAEHKRITIENPAYLRTRRRPNCMARRLAYADLRERVSELEEVNQTLSEKLDSIMDIASGEEGDDEEEDGVEEEVASAEDQVHALGGIPRQRSYAAKPLNG